MALLRWKRGGMVVSVEEEGEVAAVEEEAAVEEVEVGEEEEVEIEVGKAWKMWRRCCC
jgi:hypothetical protein